MNPELTGSLLRDVSRSFYLSLRLLPRPLREPTSLGYLLARATDTLADTTQISAGLRMQMLERFAAIIQHGGDAEEIATCFAPLQSNVAERRLIEELPPLIDWLERMDADDRADIRQVLRHVTEGQQFDISRFDQPPQIVALDSAEDLVRYTYLVAGSVGEFWTNVCARKLKNFSRRPVAEMHLLGRQYGEGLQLINILRDVGADLQNGRCYLPADELRAAGTTPDALHENPLAFASVFNRWLDRAAEGLNAGMSYVQAIANRRVRIATALPALIGQRTIELLRSAGADVLQRKVKIPRSEVRRIIARLILRGA